MYNDLATSYMWSSLSKSLVRQNSLLASNGVVLTAISLYPPKWALQLTPVPAPAPIYVPAPAPAPATSVAAAGPQVVGPSVDVHLQAARGPIPPPLPVSRRGTLSFLDRLVFCSGHIGRCQVSQGLSWTLVFHSERDSFRICGPIDELWHIWKIVFKT